MAFWTWSPATMALSPMAGSPSVFSWGRVADHESRPPLRRPSPAGEFESNEAIMLTTLLLSAMLAAGPHKPKVAVLDVRDISGRDLTTAKLLTEVASSEVAHYGRFDLITSQSIADVLGVEKQKQLLGCNDNSACLAEI